MSVVDEAFVFLHVLAALWYVAGLTSVQIALVRGWQAPEVETRVIAFSEATHYQGTLLIPGAIAVATTGLFLWGQLDYNFVTTPWLLGVEAMYIVTLLVCIPLMGMGLRRARIASLMAERRGNVTPELEEAMADSVPLVFGGIATMLVPAMVALSVFRPG
ncbi:MAG: DUF2269 family protein [Chloroflexi bacterium]|nr:DUF2269 family protein [Chloroflexota bacterium]MCI0817248.1 DUF2269 family protein [Chloroflexota bacterium]MCI0819974.1 DUF2269 family protein [Chloroflexota bacterium]MCI0832394.1 DUF2269 family protein [Chloroflexota bacterium]MCI0839212.1 DUF2269 family protein [Chloroflexota bacterium]